MSSQTQSGVRKYMTLITEHPDEEKVGCVESSSKPKATVEKNEECPVHMRNFEDDEEWTEYHVGLGYYDFESEAEYEDNDRYLEVVDAKLAEIDDEHLEKVGLDPEEFN